MLVIFKALMAAAEEYIGEVEEASLEKGIPGVTYSNDRVLISGSMENGNTFELILTVEEAKTDCDRDQP